MNGIVAQDAQLAPCRADIGGDAVRSIVMVREADDQPVLGGGVAAASSSAAPRAKPKTGPMLSVRTGG